MAEHAGRVNFLGALALLQIMLTAGIYFGVNSLVPIFEDNGVDAQTLQQAVVIASSCSLLGSFVLG